MQNTERFVFIKTRSLATSLLLKGQVTEHTTVCSVWSRISPQRDRISPLTIFSREHFLFSRDTCTKFQCHLYWCAVVLIPFWFLSVSLLKLYNHGTVNRRSISLWTSNKLTSVFLYMNKRFSCWDEGTVCNPRKPSPSTSVFILYN